MCFDRHVDDHFDHHFDHRFDHRFDHCPKRKCPKHAKTSVDVILCFDNQCHKVLTHGFSGCFKRFRKHHCC